MKHSKHNLCAAVTDSEHSEVAYQANLNFATE